MMPEDERDFDPEGKDEDYLPWDEGNGLPEYLDEEDDE